MFNYTPFIRFLALCIIFNIFSIGSYASNEIYPIKNFTTADYKAGIQNIDFAQNRNNRIFVANNLGVLSYNGNDWAVHPFESGKKIRALAFDEEMNRLYVGSQGEFGYYEKNWRYVSLKDTYAEVSMEFDEVWDVFIFNGEVYFCTFQGVFVYDKKSIIEISNNRALGKTFESNGKLYIQSKHGVINEIKDHKLFPIDFIKTNGRVVSGVLTQENAYVLFYNSGEIEVSNNFGTKPIFHNLSHALKGKYVNHILQLSDTRWAISTQTSGIFLYDIQDDLIENITTNEGLQTNACLRSFQDYNGNLWVGMQNGMALIYINAPIRFVNQKINIQGSGYDVYETNHGTYYTTSNGIYYLKKGTDKCVFLDATEGPSYSIRKIGNKLYAGHQNGLFCLENGKAIKLVQTDGLWGVKQLQSNPKFAIAGSYSGLYLFRVYENRPLELVQKIEGFNESSRFFEEDRKGRIWVGQFYKGLYRIQLENNYKYADVTYVNDPDNPLLNAQIVLSKIDNNLYLGTRDGVYEIDQSNDEIKKSPIFLKDLDGQHVYLLVQDKKKNIHVYTDKQVGFYKQVSPQNYVYKHSSLFQLRYFINNDLLNISIHTNKGVLYNANEGFIHYRPEMERQQIVDEPILTRKILSVTEDSVLYKINPFDSLYLNAPQLSVSHKSKYLQFDVESFQFNEMMEKQYRYKLINFDNEFSQWTNAPRKEYTNLPAGKYQFVVQTLNSIGNIVSSRPFNFTVKRAFYKTALAKCIYFLLILLMLLGGYRWQKKQTSFNVREKEAHKREGLLALAKEKEEKLLQLEEESTLNEIRHINNLLAASTMNLVVKNEFIENIKEKLEEVKKKGRNKETKQALEQIVKEINSTLRVQEDWTQFEYHFDQVHGDFLQRLRDEYITLSPNEQKLCAFLRLNLNTKDISNIMGISQRGVEVARYRLRKKLDLKKGQNLSKFILDF